MLCLRTDHTLPPFAYRGQTHNSKCGGPENVLRTFSKRDHKIQAAKKVIL